VLQGTPQDRDTASLSLRTESVPNIIIGVLQCVAVRCSALQCVAVRCSVLQGTREADGSADMSFRASAVCYNVLQCVAVCCSVLQCVAVCCSVFRSQQLFHLSLAVCVW